MIQYPIAEHEYTVVEFYERPGIEIMNWCLDRYGHPDPRRWFYLRKKMYFYNEGDHIMFLLRWS